MPGTNPSTPSRAFHRAPHQPSAPSSPACIPFPIRPSRMLPTTVANPCRLMPVPAPLASDSANPAARPSRLLYALLASLWCQSQPTPYAADNRGSCPPAALRPCRCRAWLQGRPTRYASHNALQPPCTDSPCHCRKMTRTRRRPASYPTCDPLNSRPRLCFRSGLTKPAAWSPPLPVSKPAHPVCCRQPWFMPAGWCPSLPSAWLLSRHSTP